MKTVIENEALILSLIRPNGGQYWYSHWYIWHLHLICFYIPRSKPSASLEEEMVSSICFSDDFGSLGMQPMLLVAARRYTDLALSSDYVLTNVPLAAEWPSVERADRNTPTPAFLNILLERDAQFFQFPLAVPLYLPVTTTTLWPLPLRAERKTLSTVDGLIQMEKSIRED